MKTVKLSEESYNKLKNRLVNEISYGTVDRAYDRANDLFWDVKSQFEDFYNTLEDAIYKARYENHNKVNYGESNPYLEKIKELAEPIYDILKKKKNQQDKFFDATTDGVNRRKFYDSPDGEENDIDDMDLRYLQSNYPK